MKRRQFIQSTAAASLAGFLPLPLWALKPGEKLRVAQIGVSKMGAADLKAISSHSAVEIVALCDVDSIKLAEAKALHANAKTYSDYRVMLNEFGNSIDAVVVSTPDHTHAPASLMAMQMDKHVYCQKPLTKYVSESREMDAVAAERNLVTQMGIQVHSFYDYKLATMLIRGGIIGKVKKVIAWSPKVWGYDGPEPLGSDPVPENLNWNLWQGTASARKYKSGFYHPGNWRKTLDYGCGTLGDMGVHIFDTPYNALELGVPLTVINNCRQPNGFGHPEKNAVTYKFPGTKHTASKLEWVWYDGKGAPKEEKSLLLPNGEQLPEQGAMFIGEKGKRLLLPHFRELPRFIEKGEYKDLDIKKYDPQNKLGEPARDYEIESQKHYNEFVNTCLNKAECSAPFSYSAKLTEVILLGVIAAQFPNKKLHWIDKEAKFKEEEANEFLYSSYREF